MIKTFTPIASLLLGLSFLLCGSGLQGTLVPLRGQAEGFSALMLGLIGSSYYLGFVLGCLASPRLILRAGHIRAYATLVALASSVTLIHPMIIDPYVWTAARTVIGFCLAGMYIIVESWLNDRATNTTRGLIMSAYIIVNYATQTIGQMMVTLAPVTSFNLFAASSMLLSFGIIPVALTTSAQPAPVAIVQFRPIRLFRVAPVGLMGSFAIGVANSGLWSLGTVFATGQGLDANGAAIFMSAIVVGGALTQWPVGKLSDRFDRRVVLAAVMTVATAVALVLAFAPLGYKALLWVGFIYGCVGLTGYSVAAAHAYDRADKSALVEMATGVLLANGVGSVIGPLVASAMMDRFGPGALFLHMVIVQLLLIAFIVYRLKTRSATLPDDKSGFDVYSTAPMGGPITPKTSAKDDPRLRRPVAEAESADAAE
ncbi:MFS transporter [Oryzibacter oryziterrae]|uniref:MFS transporter n=1 Tax=Oryzibacter oryziterrae TaxID=2766474 RepID=UPI001F233249|nr:MFS transporter [Oryzibacter oryziterrae]